MFFAKRSATTASQAQTPVSLAEYPTERIPKRASRAVTHSRLPAPLTRPGTLATPNPLTTRKLTSTLPAQGSTGNRVPIVIKGELKRAEPPQPPSRQARRSHSKRLWLLGMSIFVLTLAVTLLGITPQGQELTARISGGQINNNGTLITHQQSNQAIAPAALATTTWMYQNDGFDPYSHGEVNVSDGLNSLPWPYGQCTYWANYRYHQLSGYWIQWTGNADQWFLGAQKAGWDYGQTPPPGIPSVIVLMPYVQLAGSVGHVAVVESISGNVVHTSNMNWGYGGWTHTEDVDFTIGAGVYFVWHKPVF